MDVGVYLSGADLRCIVAGADLHEADLRAARLVT